jgi:hypothetical protein
MASSYNVPSHKLKKFSIFLLLFIGSGLDYPSIGIWPPQQIAAATVKKAVRNANEAESCSFVNKK